MKALAIPTALSLLVLTAVAPSALSAGDPNLDTGVGSAASRGPFGFSTNYDPVYETPPNDYGVWRDAYGGLRDSGMIPDNLLTRVKEPTWEETHRARGPIPGGAPGGLAGGLGGYGGFGGFGGIGGIGGIGGALGGLGLGGAGMLGGGIGGIGAAVAAGNLGGSRFGLQTLGNALSFPFMGAGAGGTGVGVTGRGPFGNQLMTGQGFLGTPGTFYPYPTYNTPTYLGPWSGSVPSLTQQVQTFNDGAGHVVNRYTTTQNGVQSVLTSDQLISNGIATTTNTFNEQGNTYTTRTVGPANSTYNPLIGPPNTGTNVTTPGSSNTSSSSSSGGTGSSGGTASTSGQRSLGSNPNASQSNQTTTYSSNSWQNPNQPNTYNGVNGFNNNPSSGTIGGGFADPSTSGSPSSVNYQNNNLNTNGNIGGGFAGPAESGSQRGVFFPNGNSSTVGGGFATPQTSGSERATEFASPINGFTGAYGSNGFGGLGGLGGFSAATGNLAGYGASPSGATSGENSEDYRSDGSLVGSRGASTGMNYGPPQGTTGGAGSSVRGTMLGTGGVGSFFGGGGSAYGPTGPVVGIATSGRPVGTMGETEPTGPSFGPDNITGGTSAAASTSRSGSGNSGGGRSIRSRHTSQRVLTRTPAPIVSAALAGEAFGSGMNNTPFSPATQTPLGYYAMGVFNRNRLANDSVAVGASNFNGNLATTLERRLAATHVAPCDAIGTVIGSIRYDSGDIVTYGSKGTLRLAPDNSGSITFNDGSIVTFTKALPEIRRIALRSTQLF